MHDPSNENRGKRECGRAGGCGDRSSGFTHSIKHTSWKKLDHAAKVRAMQLKKHCNPPLSSGQSIGNSECKVKNAGFNLRQRRQPNVHSSVVLLLDKD